MTFGLMPAGGYGEDRTGRKPGYAVTRYSAAVDISPGLELLGLMLDDYDYTCDEEFLRERWRRMRRICCAALRRGLWSARMGRWCSRRCTVWRPSMTRRTR